MKSIDKTVLVTGGARGIGRAIIEEFAENRYNVVINYLSSEKESRSLEKKLAEKGCKATTFRADVTKRDEVDAMVSWAIKTFGKIDVLVNNAGIAQQRLFTQLSEEDWDRMLAVHVKGTFNCCQRVLPQMIGRKSGKIINVSSIWGITGASFEVHYSTAKAAVIGLTKALAKELGPSNIQVNCVAPGIIETEMNGFLQKNEEVALREETPLQRFGRPQEVAQAVFFLACEKSDFITGQIISPNGGFVT